MSPLQLLQLVGYSVGAVLPLWLAALLISRRRKLTPLERVLFALALAMGVWHASNLVITLHSLFGLSYEYWTRVLRVADTVSTRSLTSSPRIWMVAASAAGPSSRAPEFSSDARSAL